MRSGIGREVRGLSGCHGAVEPGRLLCLVGSAGLLEISVREGNAAGELEARQGTVITLAGLA